MVHKWYKRAHNCDVRDFLAGSRLAPNLRRVVGEISSTQEADFIIPSDNRESIP